MVVRVLIGLLVICSACQTGKIPCPRIKSAKLQKTYKPPSNTLLSASARDQKPEEMRTRYTRPEEERYIKNVSMEEWDCPRPGSKKYMPKSVKDNIRKNKKKFEQEMKENRNQTDSSTSEGKD